MSIYDDLIRFSRVFDYWRQADSTLGDRVEEVVSGRAAGVR